MVNALLNHCKLSMINSEKEPGIVLDLIRIQLRSYNLRMMKHLKLVEMFTNKEINKKYLANLNGSFQRKLQISLLVETNRKMKECKKQVAEN